MGYQFRITTMDFQSNLSKIDGRVELQTNSNCYTIFVLDGLQNRCTMNKKFDKMYLNNIREREPNT